MDSVSDPGREQLQYLDALFDAPTTSFLDSLGVRTGWRCLEVGTGSGSIARWLSEATGTTGEVVAVDVKTEHLELPRGIEVFRHDISDGLPVEGTFDLIHARLVLMQLVRREQVFKTLADALAPGGWLVLGEMSDRPQQVLSAPSEADAELVDRVVTTTLRATSGAGVSWDWAREVDDHMDAAGLVDIQAMEYSPMISGGSIGALLYGSYARQMETLMVDAGLTEGELIRFRTLMRDPRFRAWPFMRMVLSAGRRPTGREVRKQNGGDVR